MVLPIVAPAVLLESNWWITQVPIVAWTTLSISALFGLIVWRVRAGTARAAAAGAAITACLMYGTTQFPYQYSWLHGGLPPLLTLFLLTFAATRAGRAKQQRLASQDLNSESIHESRHGRNAAQVAANLGVSALVVALLPLINALLHLGGSPLVGYAMAVAALAEAAADTVSSEIGQLLGGTPRMITTLRKVAPGINGAITLAGTVAGLLAAIIVAAVGTLAIEGSHRGSLLFWLSAPAAIFGLFFDSLLGATLEQKNLLNNDAVNFLSTVSAALLCLIEVVTMTWWLRR